MSHIKKFSYQDTSKRWLIPVAIFLTFFTLILLLSDTIFSYKQYLPYYPVTTMVLLFALIAFFAGNLSGKIFYSLTKKFIIINISFALFYCIMVSFYFLKEPVLGNQFSNLNIYIYNRYLVSLLILLPSFFGGVLNCYFLNISTGDFIDEKNLLLSYLSALFLAVITGIPLSANYLFSFTGVKTLTAYYSILPLLLISIMVFINKKFNPEPLFAKHYMDEELIEPEDQVQRDDLFYTYMNFTYIITYIFLGHLALLKFFANINYQGHLYVAVVFTALLLGYLAGKLKKPSFWYVYSEMLFPVIFLAYLFILYYFYNKIPLEWAYIIAATPPLIYGFSLRQTFENILYKYEHKKRYNIINFSLYVLPVPVLFSLSLVQFSNLVFYIILYIISIFNIIVPGLFLFNLKINPLKKISYFIFTLIFIPAVLILHLYFKIPLNMNPFYTKSDNYELLLNTNYNLPYITEKGEIKIYGAPIFYLSDSNIRNLKRASAVAAFYPGDNSKTLVIDSNQKFFRNPVFSLFPDFICLDPLTSGHVDNYRLPFSGKQQYTPVQKELLNFILDNKKSYDMILDCPNILDQIIHPYRVSDEYYALIKKQLTSGGIYAVIFDLKYAEDEILKSALSRLNSNFRFHTVYLFSDILLLLSSDEQESLKLKKNSLKRIEPLYSENTQSEKIFFFDIHPLNNILYTEFDSLLQIFSENTRFISEDGTKHQLKQLLDFYFKYNPDWYNKLLDQSDSRFYSEIRSSMQKNSRILSLIKQLEYFESINAYTSETDILFQLKKFTPYNDHLKRYIESQFSYKEKYYQSEALRLEKIKKWDQAVTLYKAILSINADNLDANYKLGLLYITLQDMDNAFIYLNRALNLEKENPQVLYQMGTLMFFNDKFKDAIDFFEQANKFNISTSLLYMYLGISYEKIGNNEKARDNYEKAIQADPNDNKLKLLLENLNIKTNILPAGEQQGVKTNMLDDEQDENITIPVNKKAINSRLKDDE